MSVSLSIDGPGDAELISAVRGGDVDAYGELFARHVDAARRLARQLAGPADADDLVSDAFTKVLTVLQRGGGPDLAFRAYLLTAVRRLHVDRIRAGSRLRPVDDLTPFDPGLPFHDTAVEGFENAAAARAFASLPERWQMVLWHTEVEQQKPADIAPLLGMSANSVSALAYRAREGLRQAFLSQHATDPDDVDCAWTRDHLGAYVRGGLSRRDSARVDDHLAACRACAAVYLELTEVNSGLGALLAPLLLGAAGAGYLSSSGVGTGGLLSTGFTAAKTWAVAHASVTAVGGMVVAATTVLTIYGATHLGGSHNAADVGSPPVLDRVPAASSLPTTTGDANPPSHDRGRSKAPGSGSDSASSTEATEATDATDSTAASAPTSAATTPAVGDSTPPAVEPSNPTSTDPGDPSTTPTDPTTTPTDPTTTPTDPTTSPTDPVTTPVVTPITFDSEAPPDPRFGDTYTVSATGGSGGEIVFSIDASTTNDACSISGSVVTFAHAGTCVIAANETAPGSRTVLTRATDQATTALQSIEVPQEDQAIEFTSSAPADAKAGGKAYTVTATAPGGPVTFSSISQACAVSGSTVRFTSPGSCLIAADQSGSTDYRAADQVTQGFDVAKGIVVSAVSDVDRQGNPQRITITVSGLDADQKARLAIAPGAPQDLHVIGDSNCPCDIQGPTQDIVFSYNTVQSPTATITFTATTLGDDPQSDSLTLSFPDPSAGRSFSLRTQV